MENTSPELQELMAVIRREHRRTQMVFGISIIILALVVAVVVPGIIRMETGVSQDAVRGFTVDTSATSYVPGMAASTSTSGPVSR